GRLAQFGLGQRLAAFARRASDGRVQYSVKERLAQLQHLGANAAAVSVSRGRHDHSSPRKALSRIEGRRASISFANRTCLPSISCIALCIPLSTFTSCFCSSTLFGSGTLIERNGSFRMALRPVLP